MGCACLQSVSSELMRDQAVAYIVAKSFITAAGKTVGLPAFDNNKKLVSTAVMAAVEPCMCE
jgi:hypothetical protein